MSNDPWRSILRYGFKLPVSALLVLFFFFYSYGMRCTGNVMALSSSCCIWVLLCFLSHCSASNDSLMRNTKAWERLLEMNRVNWSRVHLLCCRRTMFLQPEAWHGLSLTNDLTSMTTLSSFASGQVSAGSRRSAVKQHSDWRWGGNRAIHVFERLFSFLDVVEYLKTEELLFSLICSVVWISY